MFCFNRSPLFFVEYWTAICLAAAVCGFPGQHSAGDGGDGAVNDRDPDFGTAEQLDGRTKPLRNWWPVAKYRDDDDRKEPYAVAKLSGHSELIDGFFHANRRPSDKSSSSSPQRGGRHRTAVSPYNATRDGKNVDRSDPQTTTTTTNPGRGQKQLFGNENECVSANDGRPCVCYMTDFLDSMTGLLDEMTLVQDDTAVAVATFTCPTYKTVPPAFVVSPSRPPSSPMANDTVALVAKGSDGNDTAAPSRKQVDFDYVINYLLDKPKNDHFRVHYGLLGNVVKIRCMDNSTGIYAVKWDYNKDKIKSNATIVVSDTNNLMISKLESKNSINYTCVTMTEAVKGLKIPKKRYTHYVIAIDNPIYEIQGTAFYKAKGAGGGCAREIIDPMIKQLPSLVRTEICPEGSSRYACNVDVEPSKCSENESLLEVNYVVTLNDKANYLARIKTSKKGRNALFYQKLLAKISNVLVENLKRTLAIKVLSKYSSIDTIFESDRTRTTVKKFVSCGPGFGIREVFCSACPPHHYSPDKSADCLKCSKGFHQPVAGSVNCVKCPNRFASGCYVSQIPKRNYYVAAVICLAVCLLIAAMVCVCCCHEKKEITIRKIHTKIKNKLKRPKKRVVLSADEESNNSESDTDETIIESIRRNVKKKFRKSKKRELLVTDGTSDDSISCSGSSAVRRQYNKFLKFIKKSKRKVSKPNVPFHTLHENYGRSIPAVDTRKKN